MYLKDSLVFPHKWSGLSVTFSPIESKFLSEIKVRKSYYVARQENFLYEPFMLLINNNLLHLRPHVFLTCNAFD